MAILGGRGDWDKMVGSAPIKRWRWELFAVFLSGVCYVTNEPLMSPHPNPRMSPHPSLPNEPRRHM